MRVAARLHGVGDVKRYNARMAAVEYAIEHDDGQSMRALDKADVILLAPSRCGKTPTTMYLALQHGIFVANYPLVEEDFDTNELPRPVRACATAASGSPPRRRGSARCGTSGGRTPATPRWSSAASSSAGPRRSTAVHRIPSINSSTKSVEEMSTVILQQPHPQEAHHEHNVVWFADLGLADLEQVGGKNASLGEMVGQPVRGRGAGAGRFRDHRGGLPPVHRRDRAGRADQRRAEGPGHRRRAPAGRGRRGDPDRRDRAAVPGRSGGRHPVGVRAAGRRRTPRRRSPSAPAPRPRTCRTRRSPVSRRRSSTSAGSTPC